MRTIPRLLLSALLCLCAPEAWAQTDAFSPHFSDATLRIKYLRVGSRQSDTIHLCAADSLPSWSGPTRHLLDPFANGHFRIVVQDTLTGTPLYSRGFNSLFAEYRDTPQGLDSAAAFEEVVRIPWPSHTVDICWQERGPDQLYHTQHTLRFRPSQPPALPSSSVQARPSAATLQLHHSGHPHHKIDIVIVPEGYGPADTAQMLADLQSFSAYILAQEPFRSRRSDFNLWGIPSVGQASGITNPRQGLYVNSLVGASYGTFGADRYLMTLRLFQLHDVIGSTPCDHIVIMANSRTYGGGGIYNFYAMSSLDSMAHMILPHELGHSIGGLADEYVDPDLSYGSTHRPTVEPMEPNLTTLVHFERKWRPLLPAGTPIPTPPDPSVPRTSNGPLGVYEGAGYQAHGFYRPAMRCMMRDYAPFCPVCVQRLHQVFDLYTQ